MEDIRGWLGKNNDNIDASNENVPYADIILKNFSVTPVKNSAIVSLSYIDKDPKLAQAIVNSYAKNYPIKFGKT